jgi:hypothetical protein
MRPLITAPRWCIVAQYNLTSVSSINANDGNVCFSPLGNAIILASASNDLISSNACYSIIIGVVVPVVGLKGQLGLLVEPD